MPRQSTVRRLPPELREQIGALLDQGRTLDEIKAALDGLGADVSRSALGRYKQRLDKVGERIRRSREVAEALVAKFGASESKALRLNVELVQGLLTDLALRAGEDDECSDDGAAVDKVVALSAQDAMWLSKALDHLARASKADAELVGKIREQARKELEVEVASRIDETAHAQGLTAEQARFWREKVLGVR